MAPQKSGAERPRLSVAMIVRDEQEVLPATIESVRSIADEIIVLDTGSVDQTVTVAETLGARVIETDWEDDFSLARNRLLEEVAGDWVLWLDAGEQITPDSAAELRSFVDDPADCDRVYLVMVELPAAEPAGSAEQAARTRLMPARPGLRFSGRICESLQPAMDQLGLALDTAPGRIVRHPRCHLEEVKIRKAQRDLRLIEQETAARGGPTPRLLNALGEAYSNLYDPAAARRAFLQALQIAPRGSTEMLEAYYGLLTTFEGHPAEQEQQLVTCLEALEVYPLDIQLLMAMGGYLQNQNRLDLAARAFDLAIKHGKVNVETWHLREILEIAAVCRSIVLQLQGQSDEACRGLEEVLEQSPCSCRIRRHLADFYARAGRDEKALLVAESIAARPEERKPLADAIRGVCEAARKNWTAALGYLQSAYVAGCRDPLCLRWLTLTFLSNGQSEAALPVVRQWLHQEPNNREAQAYLEAILRPPSSPTAGADSTESRRLRIDPAEGKPGPVPFQPLVIECLSPRDPAPDWIDS